MPSLPRARRFCPPVVLPGDKIMTPGRLQGPDDPDLTTSDYGIRGPIHSPPWPIEQIDFLVSRHGLRQARQPLGAAAAITTASWPSQACALSSAASPSRTIPPSVPMHKHDVPVDAIVTDARDSASGRKAVDRGIAGPIRGFCGTSREAERSNATS